MEKWKPVMGYEKFYEISDYGRIKSVDRIEKTNGRFGEMKRRRLGKFLKFNKHNGYNFIELNANGISKRFSIHRLVCMNFLRKLKHNEHVHHKDGDRTNNKLSNLEILDVFDHVRIHPHVAWNKGLKGYGSGKRDLRLYESRRTKVKCVELNRIFNSVTEAAEFIQRKPNTVSTSLKSNHRTAGGYRFEYA